MLWLIFVFKFRVSLRKTLFISIFGFSMVFCLMQNICKTTCAPMATQRVECIGASTETARETYQLPASSDSDQNTCPISGCCFLCTPGCCVFLVPNFHYALKVWLEPIPNRELFGAPGFSLQQFHLAIWRPPNSKRFIVIG
jgi:hypothetical protein